MLPQRTTQEDMPSKMSRELVPPVVGKVYVSCTMRETGEVDTAAGQELELNSEVNHTAVHCLHGDKSVLCRPQALCGQREAQDTRCDSLYRVYNQDLPSRTPTPSLRYSAWT